MQIENMGSRRLMNRSLSSDGKYYGGNDITSQNSKGGCRSYLNSIRPESRSTFCSVMAQLTEDTQPTFDTTLKSKAVSEATNVKFLCVVSGHPAPEVTWYKDDVQLDRYCGLPKYQVLRDGKTHTLLIYDCTLEDAAIYQASARNIRGIVSCSGVLEVGTMSEFKIHQNYFAKLKQKNKNRCREQEEPHQRDNENVPEVLRSSPERTQRKRRSPMEKTLSFWAANSSEEKEEQSALGQTSQAEERLGSLIQEPKSAPVHYHSDSEITTNRDNANQELMYIHDNVQNASAKETAKDHYAKKKIKISTATSERNKEKKQVEREKGTEMKIRNEKGTPVEKMEVQNTVNQNKVDTKQIEKLSVKASKNATEIKRTQVAQKPILTQRRPLVKVAMATQDTKQHGSSDKQKRIDRRPLIKAHSQHEAQNTIHVLNQRAENCNPSSSDNKVMDLDDNKTKPVADTCVRILPHSCGGGDVSADTADRNVSAPSHRASAGGETHTEPTEPAICGNIPSSEKEVAGMELNQQPPLTSEVTSCVTDKHFKLISHPLASQGQNERAGDQSTALTSKATPSVTRHHKPDLESAQMDEKNSSGHDSHTIQNGQVTTAKSSSSGEDMPTKLCEKDQTKDGRRIIERGFEKPKGEIKSVATSLNDTKVNERGVSVTLKNFKERSTANTKQPVSLVTEFVQVHNLASVSDPDVVKSQIISDSSTDKTLIKHTKATEFQRNSHDNVSKMDIQEQEPSHSITSEVPEAVNHQRESNTSKDNNQHSSTFNTSNIAPGDKNNDSDPEADHFEPSTFLSQNSKILPSKFTIPVIYITDVDGTSLTIENVVCINPINESETVKFCTETNVSNSNDVTQIVKTTDHTDTVNKSAATLESEELPDAQVDLSLPSKPSEVNQHDQQPLDDKTNIQGLESQHSSENVASDFTGPIRELMPLCNAVKSNSSNESDLETESPTVVAKPDLNQKAEPNSFIKQMKTAALDLETSNQSSTCATVNATPNGESTDTDKYEQVNSEVIKPGMEESALLQRKNNLKTVSPLSPSSDVTIQLKTTDDQIITSNATHSELTETEKSNVEMAACIKQANKHAEFQELSQSASQIQSVNNSSHKTFSSPGLTRKGVTADLSDQKENESIKTKSSDKDKENQFKVPQVIRRIRPEVFDNSGHLKLWCQFFNVVSDSTIKWYKDDVEIAEINRSAGVETQVCLAIVQMSKKDCGVYRCSITNEYGQDSTEYLLGTEVLSNMVLCQELQEVGEEIEMTPLIFSKGLADAGCWGRKFYGRLTTEEAQVGTGCEHKTRRMRVIYGLDPVFESGSSCFLKVRNPIAYESREETVLAEKNLQMTKQDCRIQNMAREYFKIFAAETREIESFGSTLEIIPLYFMYRPASSVPYATVEAELKGVYLRYCGLDHSGSLVFNNKSDVTQKCSSLQHWIHQWTNGNVLFSRLEGVDTILTNIGVVTKSKGYQGFPCEANPKVFEHFQSQHQCNYFCGLLKLKPPKVLETLQTARFKGSSSPQTQRKTSKSPKLSRKPNPQTST
ncbi:alpha-protein kinase 3 isoform X2 [Paramisgurnus dabryanus]|uniref:alpha-protein kinase 3 isoform X2 n=1 Tax=Paramisgurnus dabryanus TaxID=90735 RepID=UPI0031F38DFE